MKRTIILDITPVAKPRMVHSDKWKKRPVVLNYWAFKKELRLIANLKKVKIDGELVISFLLPMPKSWSKKKKENMYLAVHKQKPDLDNLVKAFLDSLLDEDCDMWHIEASKYWGIKGRIEIERKPKNAKR